MDMFLGHQAKGVSFLSSLSIFIIIPIFTKSRVYIQLPKPYNEKSHTHTHTHTRNVDQRRQMMCKSTSPSPAKCPSDQSLDLLQVHCLLPFQNISFVNAAHSKLMLQLIIVRGDVGAKVMKWDKFFFCVKAIIAHLNNHLHQVLF